MVNVIIPAKSCQLICIFSYTLVSNRFASCMKSVLSNSFYIRLIMTSVPFKLYRLLNTSSLSVTCFFQRMMQISFSNSRAKFLKIIYPSYFIITIISCTDMKTFIPELRIAVSSWEYSLVFQQTLGYIQLHDTTPDTAHKYRNPMHA